MTPEEAQRVAGEQMWLDDNLILVLTKYEETKDQLQGLGKIETISVDEVK